MGSDSPSHVPAYPGDNVFQTLNVESAQVAKIIYDKLSAAGNTTMPLGKTFFSDPYAMFSGKFGIQWMIMYFSGE